MTTNHPITPPPELVQQWQKQAPPSALGVERITHIATQAARWGADQELKACCEHLRNDQWGFIIRSDLTRQHRAVALKLARRPKLENNG